MIMKWENDYLRIEWNRCKRSNDHWNGFHWMSTEGYLHQSITKLTTIQSHWTDILEVVSISFYTSQWGKIYSFINLSNPLRIVNEFLKLYGLLLIPFRLSRPSPSKTHLPSSVDWSFGKSASSIHPFTHSQTRLIEHYWMHFCKSNWLKLRQIYEFTPANHSNQSRRMIEN